METYKLIIHVDGGVVQNVYGDDIPLDIEIIVRDMDNINAGDNDPLEFTYTPERYYL